MLAGHETSATTLCWVLLELARHSDIQTKLRAEIRSTERAIHARGGSDFAAADLDGMPYLAAVLKVGHIRPVNLDYGFADANILQESMRYHPALYQNYRQAVHDDVLPLSKPITLTTGEKITKLPIPKGIKIIASIAGYNRFVPSFHERSYSNHVAETESSLAMTLIFTTLTDG